MNNITLDYGKTTERVYNIIAEREQSGKVAVIKFNDAWLDESQLLELIDLENNKYLDNCGIDKEDMEQLKPRIVILHEDERLSDTIERINELIAYSESSAFKCVVLKNSISHNMNYMILNNIIQSSSDIFEVTELPVKSLSPNLNKTDEDLIKESLIEIINKHKTKNVIVLEYNDDEESNMIQILRQTISEYFVGGDNLYSWHEVGRSSMINQISMLDSMVVALPITNFMFVPISALRLPSYSIFLNSIKYEKTPVVLYGYSDIFSFYYKAGRK